MADKQNWFVYKVDPRGAEFRQLGVVEAEDQPSALLLAWAEWPHERNSSQTQDGFSIRERPIRG